MSRLIYDFCERELTFTALSGNCLWYLEISIIIVWCFIFYKKWFLSSYCDVSLWLAQIWELLRIYLTLHVDFSYYDIQRKGDFILCTVIYVFDKLHAFRILTFNSISYISIWKKSQNSTSFQYTRMFIYLFLKSSFFIQTIFIVFLYTFCKFICIYFWISYLKIELEKVNLCEEFFSVL